MVNIHVWIHFFKSQKGVKRKAAETITTTNPIVASTNKSHEPPDEMANGKENDERADSPLPEIDFGQCAKVSYVKIS